MENLKRKKFTAIFDRYETVDELYDDHNKRGVIWYEVKLHLKDVRNAEGFVIKPYYWLKAQDAKDILGKIASNDEISFSAIVEEAP